MVRTKKAASKKLTAQPMDSPPESPVRQEQVVAEEVPRQEPRVAAKPEAKAVYEESEKSTESAELPLPKEREANQPTITAFFGKTPRKKSETMGKAELKKEDKNRVVSAKKVKEEEKEKKAPEVKTPAPKQTMSKQAQEAGTSQLKPKTSTDRPPATSILKKQEVEKVPTPAKMTKSTSTQKKKEALQPEGNEAPLQRNSKRREPSLAGKES